jgi:DNA-binding transcriptional MerR regulator/uncharacterized glyoxalase superfamily protein PhnB
MNALVKISEMSSRYDISARTLRYYEEMELLSSTRSDDYAYRLYDEDARKRLEQILILRKLNISIKDIRRIFDAAGSEVVLEVLGKKVDNIDDEVALLNELKTIVLDFIEQIKAADFASGDDVKRLYEKASEIETRLVKVAYEGNTAKMNRFTEVTEKLAMTPDVVQRHSYCYLIFDLGSVSDVIEACDLYCDAFGAEKTSEDRMELREGSWVGINIRLFDFGIFIQSTTKPAGGYVGCCIHFATEEQLRKAYDTLAKEAISCTYTDWGWTPLSALVTDKFGVGWLFCI